MHSFNIAILFFQKKGISQAVLSTRLWPVKALSSQGLQFLAKAEFKMPGVLSSQGLYRKRWPRASPECTITFSTHYFSTLGSFTLDPITLSQSQALLKVIMVHHKAQELQSQYRNASQRKISPSACAVHKATSNTAGELAASYWIQEQSWK